MNIAVRRSKLLREEMHSSTLENGLRVFLVPRRGMRKKTALIATKFGSIDLEFQPKPGTTLSTPPGVAHFLEHQLFKKEGRDLSMEFAKYGASSNAWTSNDTTAYFFSCTGAFEENLSLLASIAFSPFFADDYVEKERMIIEQEIRMYNDIPDNRGYSNLLRAMYRLHPVKFEIAGTVETIGQITPRTLADCHRTFYAPANMLLVISGDLDPARTFEAVERIVSTVAPSGRNGETIRRFYPTEPVEIANRRVEEVMKVSRPHLLMGFKDSAPVAGGREAVERELLTTLALELALGRGSRWHERMYASGLIDDSFHYSSSREVSFGYTAIGGETDDVDRFQEAVFDGFRKGIKDEIKQKEIDRIRRGHLGRYIRVFDAPDDIVFSCADWLMVGIDVFEVPKMLRKVSRDALVGQIERLSAREGWAMSIIRPQAL